MIDHPYSIQSLANLTQESAIVRHDNEFNIRQKALKSAALQLGAQAALAKEAKTIDAILLNYKHELNSIFDFNQLIINGDLLAPVITTSSNSVNVGSDAQQLRVAGKTYHIIQQVKFVTAAPTWRSYLYMDYPEPEMPNKVLLPKNSEEQKIWAKALQQGWMNGINQGIAIYKLNLNRLVRDYNGMVLYKKLLTQGLVSPPYVDKTYRGITGDKQNMSINDWHYKITVKPELQKNTQLWTPVVDHAAQ